MPALPETMTAIAISRPGGPEVLVPEPRPVPAPGPTQILVEVAAAGVPHLRYRREGGTGPPGGFPVAGSVVWSTWGQLREILATLHDRAVLEEKSKLSRGTYDRQHHPRVFAATLDDILAGGAGWGVEEPHSPN